MDDYKRAAAHRAVEEYVEDGMVLGLGTGSTAAWVVRRLGELLAAGELREVRGIPTSYQTTALALEFGVPLTSLSENRPDLTLDGADEISPGLDLIKGRGGALLREKIVAAGGGLTRSLVVVADESKLVDRLGRTPLPVEVEAFGWEATVAALSRLGCEAELRRVSGETPGNSLDDPFVTDGQHYVVDCAFGYISDPRALEDEIKHVPGALEVGLFCGFTRAVVVGGEAGVRTLTT